MHYPYVPLLLFSLSTQAVVLAQEADQTQNEAAPKLIQEDGKPASEKTLETITVKGTRESDSYTNDSSSSATKFSIPVQETPQTINVTTRQQMTDFHMTNARDALENTPGVSVQNQETERTSFSSRGSEISNLQTDGLGFPFESYNYQTGDIDTYVFERIEVLKGANGLTSSLGDPGATINFIRKRPTKTFQSELGLSFGSWNNKRIEGDVSGPLMSKVRGRFVAAAQDGDSYLKHYSHDKNIFSAVIDADLTDSTLLTLGHTEQRNKPEGNNWGALPLIDQNGNQIVYARDYNPYPEWAKWDATLKNSFVEIQQKLGSSWTLTATFQHTQDHQDTALVYYFGAPDANGAGVSVYPSLYKTDEDKNIADLNVKGTYPLFGQENELVLGTTVSVDKSKQRSWTTANAPTINWNGWDGQFAKPDFTFSDADGDKADFKRELTATYLATRVHFTNDFKVLLGASQVKAEGSGNSYGANQDLNESKTLPYAGITYNINENYTPYLSYSTIYRPQTGLDADGKALKAVEGDSYELGMKGSWFDDTLVGSVALFQTHQDNYPLRASDSADIIKRYAVGDLVTEGFEFDLSGRVAKNTNLSLGYTQVKMKDDKSGDETRTYLPNRIVTFLATHRLAFFQPVRVGASLRWQDETHQAVEGSTAAGPYAGTIRQGEYAVVDLMASYDITPNFDLQLNAQNVGNKKYLNGFPDGQGFYAAPANYVVSAGWKN